MNYKTNDKKGGISMLKIICKRNNRRSNDYSKGIFINILKEIRKLNNEPTPRKNNWKLRQLWINTYIDSTINNLLGK